MIETETNTPTRNPAPWLTPGLVIWSTIIICIVLIIIGTMLNRRAAHSDTKNIREKFSAILNDFDFTAEQRTTLESEFEAKLEAATTPEARQTTGKALIDRVVRSISCVSLNATVDTIHALVTKPAEGGSILQEMQARWPSAHLQCQRVIQAVDRGHVELPAAATLFSQFLAKRKEWSADLVDRLAADCARLADAAKVSASPVSFNLYESLRRAIAETGDAKE